MVNMDNSTPGKFFFDKQVAFLESRDVKGLVSTQYAQDAELVGFNFIVKGQEALLEHFERYLENLGEMQHISTEKFVETEDTVFFEATIRVSAGVARVYNAFVLNDGKATHHFTGRLEFIPD